MRPNKAATATLWYVLLGGTWIITSDLLSGLVLTVPNVQTLKGLLFIAVTAALIYWLVRRVEKIHSSTEEFRQAIIDASPIAMYSIDLDGRVLSWNRASEVIFGWSEQEVIGKPLPIVPDDKLEEFAELRSRVATGAFSGVEVTRERKGGSLFQGRLSTAPIRNANGEVVAIMATMEDVTEHKRVMNALAESEERFRMLVESAPEGILIQVAGRFAYVNAACVEIMGGDKPEDLLGMPVLERIHPDYHEDAIRRIDTLLNARQSVSQSEQAIVTLDGHTVPVESVAVPFRYQGNNAGLAFIRDISQRRAGARERERLQEVITQTADAIVITDHKGVIEYVNPAFERSSGYDRDSVIGRTPAIQKSGQHDDAFFRELWETINDGDTWRGRIVNRHKDGTLYTEDVSITPILEQGIVQSHIAVKRDITRELNLQGQLNQAQKMETVGRLAGGIAHDFNNMLSVILGYNELAMTRLASDDPIRHDLLEVASAGKRSAALTRQLLAFARQETIEPEVIDLNDSVGNSVNMLQRLIGEHIRVEWRPHSAPCTVRMDPTQIDQILANLAVNARDAIAGQGSIAIRTRTVSLTEDDCAGKADLSPGEFVILEFADDGMGMEQDILEKAFEPFFTTKPQGTGTGLGLSTVYGIIKQNHGYIEITSRRGDGTALMIYLPRHEAVSPALVRGEHESSRHNHGSETILLVEDEQALLRLGQRILEAMGYTVLATDNPATAINLASEYSGTIDLVLTDVVMPEMNGRELTQSLSKILPETRFLFTSGYTSDTDTLRDLMNESNAFLQKPYTKSSLAAKVREVLERDAEPN